MCIRDRNRSYIRMHVLEVNRPYKNVCAGSEQDHIKMYVLEEVNRAI